jgi:drug/metabolite transporter (DMT)-like permease
MSAAIHSLTKSLPIGQIIFWRSLIALIPIAGYLWLRGQLRNGLKTQNPKGHILRSAFGCLSMILSFVSLAYLPVANASALAYLAPVFTLPLAARLLGEKMHRAVMIACGLGFIGVLLMLASTLQSPSGLRTELIGLLAGLGYAATVGFVRVHVKSMVAAETPASIAFYFAITCSAVGAVSALWGWEVVDIQTAQLLALAGLLGGMAHIAAVEAVARAPISTLAPFEYTGMIWALGFDIFLFGSIPDYWTIAGVCAILAAALLTISTDLRRSTVAP